MVEHDAPPYHFRLRTPDIDGVTMHRAFLNNMVAYTKKLRSVLDGVIIDHEVPTVIYMPVLW